MDDYGEDFIKRYDVLLSAFESAVGICPPDDFPMRQRKLLWELSQYILAKDKFDYDHFKDNAALTEKATKLIATNDEFIKRLSVDGGA
jgi:hypothetical protein